MSVKLRAEQAAGLARSAAPEPLGRFAHAREKIVQIISEADEVVFKKNFSTASLTSLFKRAPCGLAGFVRQKIPEAAQGR